MSPNSGRRVLRVGWRCGGWISLSELEFRAAFLEAGEGVSWLEFSQKFFCSWEISVVFDDVRGAGTIVGQCEAEVQFFSRLWRGAGSRAGFGFISIV